MSGAAGSGTSDSEAPLKGRSVVVTRSAKQSRAIAEPLEALGAEVVSCPVIAIVDPPDLDAVDDAVRRLETYDWVVFTSANAVERFFARLVFCDRSAQALTHVQVAAVGKATADRLGRFGVEPQVVPADFRAEGLVEEFVRRGAGAGWRVLIPRALEAREILPDTLRELGVTVDVVPVYVTVPAEPDPAITARLASGGFDAVTFTSPSTFKAFVGLLTRAGIEPHRALSGVVTASIGPVTSDAMRAFGLEPGVEASPSTVPALVEALAARLSDDGGAHALR